MKRSTTVARSRTETSSALSEAFGCHCLSSATMYAQARHGRCDDGNRSEIPRYWLAVAKAAGCTECECVPRVPILAGLFACPQGRSFSCKVLFAFRRLSTVGVYRRHDGEFNKQIAASIDRQGLT